jgi:hypothetical protein
MDGNRREWAEAVALIFVTISCVASDALGRQQRFTSLS